MSFFALEEREKWKSHLGNLMKTKQVPTRGKVFLENIEIIHLDYDEFERRVGVIAIWYMDFNYNGKRYGFRKSENIDTGNFIKWGEYSDRGRTFDKILKKDFTFSDEEVTFILETMESFMNEIG